jgi:hypothetical protein
MPGPVEKLIELKLASGLSSPHRQLIDLAGVQRLVEVLGLSRDLGDRLDASVAEEYRRLWARASPAGRRLGSTGRANGLSSSREISGAPLTLVSDMSTTGCSRVLRAGRRGLPGA